MDTASDVFDALTRRSGRFRSRPSVTRRSPTTTAAISGWTRTGDCCAGDPQKRVVVGQAPKRLID